MKYLKKFNESVTRFPQYKRGEILVFGNDDNDDIPIKSISKLLGYKYKSDYIMHNCFLIETPIGKENEAGSDFVNNYPEFFTGYERRDLRYDFLIDEIENITNDISNLSDSLGKLNDFGVFNLSDDWNQNIDTIISKLKNIKY